MLNMRHTIHYFVVFRRPKYSRLHRRPARILGHLKAFKTSSQCKEQGQATITTKAHIVLNLRSLILGFGEICTTIVHGITSQPTIGFSNAIYLHFRRSPNGWPQIESWAFRHSVWGYGRRGLRDVGWWWMGSWKKILVPRWHAWSISYRFWLYMAGSKSFSARLPVRPLGYDDNSRSGSSCFVGRQKRLMVTAVIMISYLEHQSSTVDYRFIISLSSSHRRKRVHVTYTVKLNSSSNCVSATMES